MKRKAYPSDITVEEWEFVPPYVTLMSEDAPHREYDLRDLFNGLRWMIRIGVELRMIPNDFPVLAINLI